jgi:hypothetical protein
MSHSFDATGASAPVRKRQKSAPSKRSIPARPRGWEGTEIRQQNEAMTVVDEIPRSYRNPVLESISPLDPDNLSTKDTPSSRLVTNVPKLGPFKNPVITKPIAYPEPEIQRKADATNPKILSNHPGWTTTQEVVKLSKTTLDRLTSFRYQSSTKEASAVGPGKSSTENATEIQKMEALLAKNYSDFPRVRCPTVNLDMSPSEILPDAHPTSIRRAQARGGRPDTPTMELETLHNMGSILQGDSSFQTAVGDEITKHKDLTMPRLTAEVCDLSDRRDWLDQNHSSVNESGVSLRSTLLDSEITPSDIPCRLLSFSEPQFTESGVPRETPSGTHDDTKTISRATYVQPDLDRVNRRVPRQSKVQENLGIHSVTSCVPKPAHTINSTETILKECTADEFDVDIDDADMLYLEFAIDANESGTETPPWGSGILPRPTRFSPFMTAPEAGCQATTGASESMAIKSSNTVEYATQGLSASILESDDEYPLDEGEEEEMLEATEQRTYVEESYQASANLHYGGQKYPVSGEVYDQSLYFSPVKSRVLTPVENWLVRLSTDHNSDDLGFSSVLGARSDPRAEDEECSHIRSDNGKVKETPQSVLDSQPSRLSPSRLKLTTVRPSSTLENNPASARDGTDIHDHVNPILASDYSYILDDSHEYLPLPPFARPDFPALTRDGSPIVGVSARTFLRVCFRIGEMFNEGGRCDAMSQNAVIELFARVTSSSREPGTTKQHFQFADLWHDRPPFPSGVMANYKPSVLSETESRIFLGASGGVMARCLGTLKREKSPNRWLLHITSIRPTDWEEIRWTKRIVSAGVIK